VTVALFAIIPAKLVMASKGITASPVSLQQGFLAIRYQLAHA